MLEKHAILEKRGLLLTVAILVTVAIGRMNDEEAEIRGGLGEGDRVVLHPSDPVEDGVRVKERD